MKTKTVLITGLILIAMSSFSQLKQEKILNGKYKTLQLDNGEIKYIKYNKKEKTVFIYNIDNSVWKTIKLPLPKGHLLDEIKMISQTTFNNDKLIEIMYSCVVYDFSQNFEDTDDVTDKISFTLNLINEKGEVLLKVADSNNMEILESNGVKKLFVYKHIGQDFNTQDQTIVYSLPTKN